jgi:2-(1,2-epoxy-1,2-dihydrophenyl)acetyl-CoA isomerase
MNLDAYFMEYDDERSGDFRPLRYLPKGKIVVLGLVTTKFGEMESKDALKRRIDEAAQYAPLEQLALSPQCGFSSTVHGNNIAVEAQRAKLRLVVETAQEVWGLNRPASLNSFTGAMHAQLRAALDAAAADDAVRCVVITGAGRGFCAGQDLNDADMASAGGGAPDVGAVIERLYKPLALRIRAMPVPVIAMVNGVAAGAGANFALGCDVVVAARSASFIQAFSKIGLIPDCGGTWLLPRLVGRARAIALAMSGDKLSAEEAERIGMIWRSVDDPALVETTMALATKLAAMPSRALAETRRAIDDAMPMAYADALGLEGRVQGELGRGGDFAEGVAAFFAKRAPRFKDR